VIICWKKPDKFTIVDVENEIHFLLECPSLANTRREILDQIESRFSNLNFFDNKSKFVWLLSTDDHYIYNQLGSKTNSSLNNLYVLSVLPHELCQLKNNLKVCIHFLLLSKSALTFSMMDPTCFFSCIGNSTIRLEKCEWFPSHPPAGSYLFLSNK
jgi:hypothetical protein